MNNLLLLVMMREMVPTCNQEYNMALFCRVSCPLEIVTRRHQVTLLLTHAGLVCGNLSSTGEFSHYCAPCYANIIAYMAVKWSEC